MFDFFLTSAASSAHLVNVLAYLFYRSVEIQIRTFKMTHILFCRYLIHVLFVHNRLPVFISFKADNSFHMWFCYC